MIEHASLERSKAIQRRTGRTFYFATRLLPTRVRHPTYVLYAFFRIADDVVDDPDPPSAAVRRRALDRLRRQALGEQEADDPVVEAFRALRDEYGIPDREVDAFVAAMAQDISADGYETYADLEEYLRGSSVAVAYMLLAVMEPENAAAARPHARALGEAFQLTNFLRDVREDVVEYDRIYLPRSTLERHGVTGDDIERLAFTEGFSAVMRTELERTEALYRQGVDGIELLPDDCQFAVLLAAVLYADHHRLIRSQGYDVLSNRPTLPLHRRVELLVRTAWHWLRTGDPRATFEAVSALESPPIDDESGATGDADTEREEHAVTRTLERIVGTIRSRIGTSAAK